MDKDDEMWLPLDEVQTEINSGKDKWVWDWCGGPVYGKVGIVLPFMNK